MDIDSNCPYLLFGETTSHLTSKLNVMDGQTGGGGILGKVTRTLGANNSDYSITISASVNQVLTTKIIPYVSWCGYLYVCVGRFTCVFYF